MFISTGVLVFLQGFVVRVVVGRSPSNLYPFMDVDFCSLNLCFISCSSTKGSGNVPGLVLGPHRWLCVLFYFHYHEWEWPGCKRYRQEDAETEDLHFFHSLLRHFSANMEAFVHPDWGVCVSTSLVETKRDPAADKFKKLTLITNLKKGVCVSVPMNINLES